MKRFFTPTGLRRLMHYWPPYWGTAIRVRYIAADWREVRVEMPLRWYNKNYVGVHFGGSLFAMTDPFHMLMLSNILGSGYRVWDQAAQIRFVSPGRGAVSAHFLISDREIETIVNATAGGAKHLQDFAVDVVGADGTPVAQVVKTLYVRRKRAAGATKTLAPR